MSTRHLALTLAAGLLLGPLAATAGADPVRIDFTIDVRYALGDLGGLFGAPIAVGDVVAATLIYDGGAPDLSAASGVEGHYRPAGSISFATSAALAVPLTDLWVFDETFDPRPRFDDVFTALAYTDGYPGFDALQIELSFRGGGRSGDALPSAADVFASFPQGGIRFAAWQTGVSPPFDSGTHELSGTLRRGADEPEPVPEPGTLILFATGAVTLARRYRRPPRPA